MKPTGRSRHEANPERVEQKRVRVFILNIDVGSMLAEGLALTLTLSQRERELGCGYAAFRS